MRVDNCRCCVEKREQVITEAEDFRDESESLYDLLDGLDESAYCEPTLFKNWSTNQVLRHLHMWNWAACLALTDDLAFVDFYARLSERMQQGTLMSDVEREFCADESGPKLLQSWRKTFEDCAGQFRGADPKARLKWAGPDMSARSSITARQMETWAHGQAVFDLLGVVREDDDRVRNIAFLGMNTFGWTFVNRGQEVPAEPPQVILTAPSGDTWEWHRESGSGLIRGSATEFCQVVTQTRNIADTSLKVEGEVATRWMKQAQCFAGPAESPPAPGTRHIRIRYT